MAPGAATGIVTSMSDGDAGANDRSDDHPSSVDAFAMWSASAPSMLAVLELLTRLPGCPIDEFMRLGQALATMGRPDDGARALEGAADRFGGSDGDQLRRAATRLWAQLN